MLLGKYQPSHVILLPKCYCKQAAVWNPNDSVLYLLVKGISYFLTITLSNKKSVKWKNYCRHTPCKQTRGMQPLGEGKQNGSAGVWRTKCRKEKEKKTLSHSDNSVLLTPSHHRTMTTKIWQLSGDPQIPPRFQLERLERSQDKSRRVS